MTTTTEATQISPQPSEGDNAMTEAMSLETVAALDYPTEEQAEQMRRAAEEQRQQEPARREQTEQEARF